MISQNLESQLRHKEGEIQGASSSVKNLELSHVAGITDLRGRVIRCDTAIGKLAADVRLTNESLKTQSTHNREHDSRLTNKTQVMDIKVRVVNRAWMESLVLLMSFILY